MFYLRSSPWQAEQSSCENHAHHHIGKVCLLLHLVYILGSGSAPGRGRGPEDSGIAQAVTFGWVVAAGTTTFSAGVPVAAGGPELNLQGHQGAEKAGPWHMMAAGPELGIKQWRTEILGKPANQRIEGLWRTGFGEETNADVSGNDSLLLSNIPKHIRHYYSIKNSCKNVSSDNMLRECKQLP